MCAECVMTDFDYKIKLEKENEKLKDEIKEIKEYYSGVETEFNRMRAQLDIVYLIFGGVNRD